MPFAVAMAMRTPVNDPGPRPTHTQAMSPRATESRFSSASMRGSSCVLDARRAAWRSPASASTVFAAASSSPTPMAIASLDVSNARTYFACSFSIDSKIRPYPMLEFSSRYSRKPGSANTNDPTTVSSMTPLSSNRFL